jgi:hypothetical protein
MRIKVTGKRVDPTELECAMAAAYIDSEGCISLGKGQTRKDRTGYLVYVPRLLVSNIDPRLPIWLQERFGGAVLYRECPSTKKSRPVYTWGANQAEIGKVLRQCLPYFIIKKREAELMLEFLETRFMEPRKADGTWGKVTKEKLAVKEQKYQDLKAYKRRSYPIPGVEPETDGGEYVN